jgi:alcohol dehydrogenase (cytochrome c)
MVRSISFKRSILAGVVVIAAGTLVAVAQNLPRTEVEIGKAAFERRCATCHGAEGAGGAGPSLVPATQTNQGLLSIVRQGGAQMPPLTAAEISDAEVAAVAAYLRGLRAVPPQSAPPAPPALRAGTTTLSATRNAPAVTDAMLANPDPANWLSWRRTLDGWGHSPLDQINTRNVRNLKLVWSWGLEAGPSQTTPVVYDGVMYIANPGGTVQALDARTGNLQWEYRREGINPQAQMRSLAIYEDLLIMTAADAHIVGLDARTGAVRWDTAVAAAGQGFNFTSGAIIVEGAVVASVTGCSRFGAIKCFIVALDARTGKELWRTATVARPGEPGGDTWGDLPLERRAGGDAWIPGSYDPVNKLIYWGTAQAKPWARRQRGDFEGEELYTNSTLALDPATGAIKWHFQHIPGDTYDMDETFERILIDYDGKSSVFSMGKLGILWENDRKTGRFVRATDTGYQNQVDVDPRSGKVTYRPGMIQVLGEEIFFCPTTGGLKSLRAMSYHPATGALYVPLNIQCETAIFQPTPDAYPGGAGPVQVKQYHFHPKSPAHMGELRAMDVRTGKTLWSHRQRAPYNTATLSTGGGLVFAGTLDRYMFAHDAKTGQPLWETRLPTMANGFPITYAVGGRQYIAFGAGASITGSTWVNRAPDALLPELHNPRAGNGIFVFAISDE